MTDNKNPKETFATLGKLLAFSLLTACYFIMTNEAVPALRQADASIVVYRSLGMMLVFCVPSLWPKVFCSLLDMPYFKRTIVAVLLLGITLCFLLAMLIPLFLYSGLFAFIIGIVSAVAICYLITIFKSTSARDLLLYMPYVLLVSIVFTLVLLLLPEPYHEYAILFCALFLAILGFVFQKDKLESSGKASLISPAKAIQRKPLIRIFLLTVGLGVTNEIIRLLSFDKLYETPDILYMTYCVITFLALLTALCFALYRSTSIKSLPHILILISSLVVLSILTSLFTWLGHRGLFVFTGNSAFFLGSLFLPLVYALRRSLLAVQVVAITQFGIAAGFLLGFLGRDLIVLSNLNLEFQVIALFLNIVLLCVVLLSVIFGVHSAENQTPSNPKIQMTNPDHSDFADFLASKGLTGRQAEVAALVAKGYSATTISEELFISQKTVGNHMSKIYKSLEIHNKQELINCYQSFKKTGS